jgi:hypothetical protein
MIASEDLLQQVSSHIDPPNHYREPVDCGELADATSNPSPAGHLLTNIGTHVKHRLDGEVGEVIESANRASRWRCWRLRPDSIRLAALLTMQYGRTTHDELLRTQKCIS